MVYVFFLYFIDDCSKKKNLDKKDFTIIQKPFIKNQRKTGFGG